MENDYTVKRETNRPWKRLLCFLLVLVSLIGQLPMTAWAEDIWDGSGSGSDGNGTTISSGACLESTSAYYSIMGYRFSVHDASGNKTGHSADIQTRSTYTWYRVAGGNKQSHVELYKIYALYANNSAKYPAPTLTGISTSTTYVYSTPTSETSTPFPSKGDDFATKMGEWLLEEDSANAKMMAKTYCGVDGYDAETHFIIIEPLYAVSLFGDGNWYALTMAELAVFQSGQVEAARAAYNEANPGTYSSVDGWTNVRPAGTSRRSDS